MWWNYRKKDQETIRLLREEIIELKNSLYNPYNPDRRSMLLPISYSKYHKILFDGLLEQSRIDFNKTMLDMYAKFKYAETTKEAQQYLVDMDEVIRTHLEFFESLPNLIINDTTKIQKFLDTQGNNSKVSEKTNQGENHEENNNNTCVDDTNSKQ